jgi:hypothetical protein
LEHDAKVIVGRSGDEESSELQDHIAYFRGFEMVVKYERLAVHGGVPFCGIVLCGEATGSGEDDLAAEQFLRIAEPPEHHTWELTPVLKAEYAQGSGKTLREFFDGVKATVRDLVRPESEELDDGPRGIKELLKLGDEVDVVPRPRLYAIEGALEPDGSWSVNAEVRLPDARAWMVEPVLTFAAETGVGRRVDWTLTTEPPSRAELGQLFIPAGAKRARFRGVSSPASHPVDGARCAVRVALKAAKPEEDRSE